MPRVTFDSPAFTNDDAGAIGRRHYGLDAASSPLPSERDQNFLLTTASNDRHVLKISNAGEDPRVIDLQNAALLHLATVAPDIRLPRVRHAADGQAVVSVPDAEGTPHLVRLLTWVPGRMLARVEPHTPELLRSVGTLLGAVDAALETFAHPASERDLKWDPRRAGWIREYFHAVGDPARRTLVERLFAWSEEELSRLAPELRTGVIYNDANDYNVLVDGTDPYARRVTSVVDFGDMLHTWIANEVAVGCAYAMLDKPDPLAAAAPIVEGYHAAYPLGPAEIEALFPLICSRLAVSVVNSAVQRHADPGNEYLTVSERPAWELLERLGSVHPRFAHYTFRGACGLEPCPASPGISSWLRGSAGGIGPLLDPDPRAAPRVVFDLAVDSLTSGTPAVWSDTRSAARKIARRMEDTGAAVGIGCYDEVRGVYTSDAFVKPGNDGPSSRTVHLGLDLFVRPGTPVLAPLDGVVHSIAVNDTPLDYGPTIVLEHEAGPAGPRFYTLYGHLSNASASALTVGDTVRTGRVIARVGTAAENGGWPTHLHFQLISDLLDLRSDFPGVADPAERRVWLSLVPDPNLVARIPGGVTARRRPSGDDILTSRRDRVGPSLSVSYRRPLTIVRGWMQHLYDADGRTYLDAVNNVPHVGHCHPRVVEAGRRQMAVLNTNTRYLHERARASTPSGSRPRCRSRCASATSSTPAAKPTNSPCGLRDASPAAATPSSSTSATTAIRTRSSRSAPTSSTAPAGRRTAVRPRGADARRVPRRLPGRFRGCGRAYAAHVAIAVDRLQAAGRRMGAFIAESMLSCGGQIVLPDGYFHHAYEAVRAAGGLCIADEVQVGFGRVGTHFWAFETQGVVPDIVTMGKPIGNGHPLGAVVTTPEIARAFANGMEYFNTYGGNPVSCAIGLAVLDVIGDEGLQARALEVGQILVRAPRADAPSSAIGDVRGLGLFVGIELVRDRETREPAGTEAGLVANRMRDKGILVSTDGPFHNVLKIKPPLCFTAGDAGRLVSTLDGILGEDYLQM